MRRLLSRRARRAEPARAAGGADHGEEVTALDTGADPALTRLADAILIPPFPGVSAPGRILEALSRGLAGVTLFGPNIAAPDQVAALTLALRSAAAGSPDPVIAIDEEGGDVTRVAYHDGSPYPGNAALGAVDDISLTRAVYQAIGADLAALGINFDLAPCADVLGCGGQPGRRHPLVRRGHRPGVAAHGRRGDRPAGRGRGRVHQALSRPRPDRLRIRTRPSPPSRVAWPSCASVTCRPSPPRSRPGSSPSCRATCACPNSPATCPPPCPAAARGRAAAGRTRVHRRDRLRRAGDAGDQGHVRCAPGRRAGRSGGHGLCCAWAATATRRSTWRSGRRWSRRFGTERSPETRLEEAADRVARLRGGLARTRSLRSVRGFRWLAGMVADGVGLDGGAPGGVGVRTAVRAAPAADHRGGTAGEHRGGAVRVGPGPVGAGRERPAGQDGDARRGEGILGAAAGRSLVAVVRDAHRDRQHALSGRASCSRRGPMRSWWRWACRDGSRRRARRTWPRTAPPGPARRPPPSCSGWPGSGRTRVDANGAEARPAGRAQEAGQLAGGAGGGGGSDGTRSVSRFLLKTMMV